MRFEVCVDSVEGALAAQRGGAHRVELCANLIEGGVTPSIGQIRLARRSISIGLHVLIRPRGGDFLYSPLEFDTIREDLLAAKNAGADGVVLGILLPDGRVDVERTGSLVDLARPLSLTFHRAIDLSRDSEEALDALIHLGVDRVLTSGRRAAALQGADEIARLLRQSAGRIAVMAGGGVTAENLPTLVAATGVREVHFSSRVSRPSAMSFRNPDCFMGKAYQPDEYSHRITDENLIRAVTCQTFGSP